MRRANRKDTTHAPIVAALESHGLVVYDMPDPGDILVYGFHRVTELYVWMPMEIKSGNHVRHKKADCSDDLTPRQKAMRARKSLAPIPVVKTPAEAIRLFGISTEALA